MKKIFVAIMAVASFVACTNDEVMDFNKQEIAFTNAFVENATRANDAFTVTTSTLGNFQVYGTTKGDETGAAIVPIFDYVTVSNEADAWAYSASNIQYWIDGNTYNFVAVKNVNKADVTLTDGVPSAIKYDAATQADFLYAANPFGQYTQGTSVTKVPFTFDHKLSKVFFTFRNTMTTNVAENMYTYRVSNIKINNAVKAATYKPSGVWEDETAYYTAENALEFGNITKNFAEGANQGEAALIGAVGATDESTSLNARLVIPHAYTALNITCTIETLLNGAVVNVETYNKNIAQTFDAGKVYNFVLTRNNPGAQIQFTVNNVNAWDENHTGYNPGVGI